jgi:hypothetical protein
MSSTAAKGQVRVIEDKTAVKNSDPEGLKPDTPAELSVENRPGGFHVRPVPIDQPFKEA